MKKSKLKLITKILAIVVICLVSFIGIYVQKYNKMENIIKGYDLANDLSGYRQIIIELSDAKQVTNSEGKVIGNTDQYDDEAIKTNSYKKSKTSVNKEEDLKKENYQTSKNIIEKRLNLLGIEDYNLSIDNKIGKMYLQIPENQNADRVVSNIVEKGSFEIKDSEDGTVHITREHLKKASAMYSTTETGTVVYLHMQLDKEGTAILKDISTNQYVTIEETQEETNETEKNDTTKEENKSSNKKDEEEKKEEQKKISLSISGNDMITTSFEDPIQDGVIDLTMNAASKDNEEVTETLATTSTISTILESGELPLLYKVTGNQYVKTDISETLIRNAVIIVGTILIVLLVFMIIKNKLKGILGVINYLGFIAIYLLLIRYTNVAISISGFIAISLVFIINYILNMKLLSIGNDYKQEYYKFITKMIPLLIISIVFIFVNWIPLSSFGMLLFWGIGLMMIYNILVTKNIVD